MSNKEAFRLPIEIKDFAHLIHTLAGKYDTHTIWSDFIEVCACSISNAVDKTRFKVREQMYLDIVKKYSTKELNTMSKLFAAITLALERNPRQDFLGRVYEHLGIQQQLSRPGIYPLLCL